jgi:hypothetical protein
VTSPFTTARPGAEIEPLKVTPVPITKLLETTTLSAISAFQVECLRIEIANYQCFTRKNKRNTLKSFDKFKKSLFLKTFIFKLKKCVGWMLKTAGAHHGST